MHKLLAFSIHDKYLLPILYLIVFLAFCGSNIGGAPRTQMYEKIICQNQYGNITLGDNKDSICKSREVQEELAFLKGADRMLGVVPTIVVIPYSYFGEKYGRPFALSLALAGIFLSELWNTLICWFSLYVPIRMVLFASAFELIGGGSVILNTMIYLIAAEHVTEDFRTSVFFFIKATVAVAVLSEQLLSSMFMNHNLLWVPMLVGLAMVALAAGIVFIIPKSSTQVEVQEDCNNDTTPLLPEGTLRGEGVVQDPISDPAKVDRPNGVWKRLRKSVSEARTGFLLIFRNFQLLLILFIGFVSDLSEASVNMIFLLYTSKRFGWDFAHVNYLSAFSGAVQFGFLVIILPIMSNILISHYAFSPYSKDQFIGICSLITFTTGSLLLGFGSQIWVVIIGLLVFSTACGMQSVLRSIITNSILPSEVSIVYSVFNILHLLSGSLAGPLYSGTFTAGMNIGGFWLGLPFVMSGALAILALGGMAFLREKRSYDLLADDDSDA